MDVFYPFNQPVLLGQRGRRPIHNSSTWKRKERNITCFLLK